MPSEPIDAFGNRTSMTTPAGATSYTYDNASRLTSVTPPSPAPAVSYTWDNNGDLTQRGSDTFTWDFEDRMKSATVGGVLSTFTYSGDGLRNTRTTGGVTDTFTWDIAAGIPQVLDDGSARYVYGAGLIEQRTNAGNPYYYLSDGLGSVLKTTDAAGNIVNSYSYDVYGKTTSSSGGQVNDRQFAGEQTDATGLQYLRTRYYDPSTGAFLSRDRLASAPSWRQNPSAYVAANPANVVDPFGTWGFGSYWQVLTSIASGAIGAGSTAGSGAVSALESNAIDAAKAAGRGASVIAGATATAVVGCAEDSDCRAAAVLTTGTAASLLTGGAAGIVIGAATSVTLTAMAAYDCLDSEGISFSSVASCGTVALAVGATDSPYPAEAYGAYRVVKVVWDVFGFPGTATALDGFDWNRFAADVWHSNGGSY